MTVCTLSGIFKGNKTFRIITQVTWDCIQNVKHRGICERWKLCLGIQRKRVIHKVENRLRLRNVIWLEIPEGKDTEGILQKWIIKVLRVDSFYFLLEQNMANKMTENGTRCFSQKNSIFWAHFREASNYMPHRQESGDNAR